MPGFSKVDHASLCTCISLSRQVPSKHDSLLTFGPVVPDGYGICYNPMPHQINFCVSAWRSCAETDARTLMNSLVQALEDARSVLLQTRGAKL